MHQKRGASGRVLSGASLAEWDCKAYAPEAVWEQPRTIWGEFKGAGTRNACTRSGAGAAACCLGRD
jgi:hypothetical protein